jgi:2C-methyl-D-erythritol 2,4-cyclodiphosphate synthase
MVAGYDRNWSSATAVLAWLTDHHDADPVIVSAVDALLARLATRDIHEARAPA